MESKVLSSLMGNELWWMPLKYVIFCKRFQRKSVNLMVGEFQKTESRVDEKGSQVNNLRIFLLLPSFRIFLMKLFERERSVRVHVDWLWLFYMDVM